VLEQRIHLGSEPASSRVYPVCTTPGMSSSSAYYLSSRHSDSEEEWTVSNSPCSDSSQRDDDDSIGTEEFLALRHLGYEWVNSRVKLPLSRFSKSVAVVAFRKKYDIVADTVDERIISIERAKSGDSVCHGRKGH